MSRTYDQLLANKAVSASKRGFDFSNKIRSDVVKPHQFDVIDFSCKAGSSACFLDTGLGKTLTELEFSRIVTEYTNKPTLLLAPLAVSKQHKREAERFGIDAKIATSMADIKGAGIYITNYEKLKHFDKNAFACLVMDESSIVKSFNGKTTAALMEFSKGMRFKMAATATPAPNDYMELGQHSQLLEAMDSHEMLARWFVADQSEMGKYRLKKHGVNDFWRWVASWARCVGKPSDLGYSDDGYILTPFNEILHFVDVDMTHGACSGELIRKTDMSATAIHKEKRITSDDRARKAAEIVANEPNEPWMIWVDTDYDAEAFLRHFPDAIEVSGKMKPELKEERLDAFSNGQIRVLLSKPKIAGMGLNWQHCARAVYVGMGFSYEAWYQSIRRFWRFGQKRVVDAHMIFAQSEQQIWANIKRKKIQHEQMKIEMFSAMKDECVIRQVKTAYAGNKKPILPSFLS